ncbi:hypothetical protein [Pseudomonas putida]|nr:hypothetical protein [Pseudomonas putida]
MSIFDYDEEANASAANTLPLEEHEETQKDGSVNDLITNDRCAEDEDQNQ